MWISDVDNHRMFENAYDWDGVKTIYEEGEYAEKSIWDSQMPQASADELLDEIVSEADSPES